MIVYCNSLITPLLFCIFVSVILANSVKRTGTDEKLSNTNTRNLKESLVENIQSRQGLDENDEEEEVVTLAPGAFQRISSGVATVVASALTGQFGTAFSTGLKIINNRNGVVDRVFENLGFTTTISPISAANITTAKLHNATDLNETNEDEENGDEEGDDD